MNPIQDNSISQTLIFNTSGHWTCTIVRDGVWTSTADWLGVCRNGKVYSSDGKYLGTVSSDNRLVRERSSAYERSIGQQALRGRMQRPQFPGFQGRKSLLAYPYEDVFEDSPVEGLPDGIVVAANPSRDMYAVDIDESPNSYSIIEVSGGDFEIGDRIRWFAGEPALASVAWHCRESSWIYPLFQNHGVHAHCIHEQLLCDADCEIKVSRDLFRRITGS